MQVDGYTFLQSTTLATVSTDICGLLGSAAFTGLGVYSYASGMSQLRQRELEILKSGTRYGLGARRASIYVLSASLVGIGAYRLVN